MAGQQIQRVIKVGNALAVVIPRPITRALNIQRGDNVAIFCTDFEEVRVRLISEEKILALRLGNIES